MSSDRPRFLSAAEVAEELGVSEATAYRLMKPMQTVRIGKLVKVERSEVEKWIDEHTTGPASATAAKRVDSVTPNRDPLIRPIVPRRKRRSQEPAEPSIRPTQPRRKRRDGQMQ